MAGYRLELPTVQNWSCHNCGGCCRQHLIELTDEEKRRIEGQNWTAADGVPTDRPLIVPHGPIWARGHRLGHQADGACVFLNEQGLCRIHAKFGEAAKPLACRIYPYAFHPAGREVTVSLRFSCPSVVANRGRPVSQQLADVRQIARLVVPDEVADIPPPALHGRERVDWGDTLRIVAAIEDSVVRDEGPLILRLLRTLYWIEFVGRAKFEKIRGERIDELIEMLREASHIEVLDALGDVPPPTSAARMQFRMLVAQYARRDTAVELVRGWSYRWKLLKAALRFARGKGDVPPLQEGFRPVPFDALERPFGGLPDGADELLTRYFEVKIHGLHFCGRGYYDVPVVEGFYALALVAPTVCWLAKWRALSDGRTRLTLDDVQRALAIADHHHGYDPALGAGAARSRVRQLAATEQIGRLCVWHAR